MQVRDHRKLARLMVIQGISQRQMAKAIGWQSHSYMGRIMRGKITNVDPEAASKMAYILGVAVDDIFLVKVSVKNGHAA